MRNLPMLLFLFLVACAPSPTPAPTKSSAAPVSSAASSIASTKAPASSAASVAPTKAPVGPLSPSATPARSSIALTNVQQNKQPDGSVRTTAKINVQDNLGVGQMDIASPDTMPMGESRTIRLKVAPAEQFAALTPAPAPGKTPDLPQFVYRFSGNVQLYPVMIAELRALAFTIDRTGPQRRDVKLTEPVTWDWIVSPRSQGRQDLSIEISIPGVVNGVYSEMSTSVLQNIPVAIQVQPPAPTATPIPTPAPGLDAQVRDSIIANSGAILAALIGLVGTLVGIFIKMKFGQK
jgi:hypothetical protein